MQLLNIVCKAAAQAVTSSVTKLAPKIVTLNMRQILSFLLLLSEMICAKYNEAFLITSQVCCMLSPPLLS